MEITGIQPLKAILGQKLSYGLGLFYRLFQHEFNFFLGETADPALLKRIDELVHEGFAGQIPDLKTRLALEQGVGGRVHQVRLAQADSAVQEEGVV